MVKSPDLSELFSVKGIWEMIIIAIFVFVLVSVVGVLKQTSPSPEVNETLTNIEENAVTGFNLYLFIAGIVGTVVFIIVIWKIIMWAIEEFGSSI
jgi:hypothetical protein